jgi:hypothetical protein
MLPEGSIVSAVMNNGEPKTQTLDALKDMDQDSGMNTLTFSFTDFFGVSAADFAGTRYSNKQETYRITITGNTVPVNTTMTLNTFLFKSGADDVVLEEASFPLTAVSDMNALIAAVQSGMVLGGSFGSELTATFPATVPPEFAAEGYKVNSAITLGAPLPTGSSVAIIKDDAMVVSGKDLGSGTTFTFTELFGVNAAGFDTDYSGKIERYKIIITGNTVPIHTTLTLATVISKDSFATSIPLDEKTYNVDVASDMNALLKIVQDGMTITGNADDGIIAKFPVTIPAEVPCSGLYD